jgi:hypothetical protein
MRNQSHDRGPNKAIVRDFSTNATTNSRIANLVPVVFRGNAVLDALRRFFASVKTQQRGRRSVPDGIPKEDRGNEVQSEVGFRETSPNFGRTQEIDESRVDKRGRTLKRSPSLDGFGEGLTMATNLRWVLVVIGVLVGSKGIAGGVDVEPLVLAGIEYRVDQVQDGPDAPLKASLRAIDRQTSAELWRVRLYEGTSRESWLGGSKNPRVVGLSAFATGIVAKVDDGATFYVDIASRKAEIVRDMRPKETTCGIHHRPLVGFLAPIHYGLCRPIPAPQQTGSKAPLVIEGGCCVMPEKTAIVAVCPDCR